MNRLSEQRARLGSFVGDGLTYIAAKTALTRSQWLMLTTFAVGAVVIGFATTRWSKPRSWSSQATTAANQAPNAIPVNDPAPDAMLQRSGVTAGAALPTPASAQPVPSRSGVSGAKSDQGVEPATRSMLEGLAKDIARINQKLDDLAGKQKQTANRLASLIADGKQSGNRPPDNSTPEKAASSNRKPVTSAAPKASIAVPLPAARVLTVRPTRKAQRPTEAERRHRAIVDAVITRRRNNGIAERSRQLHRRRIASRSIFGLRF